MSSFISFRDVSNVLASGSALQGAGATLDSAVRGGAGPLESRGNTVFTKRDGYSQGFWNDTYAPVVTGVQACEPRHLDLMHQGTVWAERAKTMGEDVVTAATRIIWQDAISAAELASANVVET
jgi:hypothetical protein